MEKYIKNTIDILDRYNIGYVLETDGRLTINGDLHLYDVSFMSKGFLSNTTINGKLYINSLLDIPKDFLSNGVAIGGVYQMLLLDLK